MERLHKLAYTLAILSCSAFGTASTQGKCSLRVNVLSPEGRSVDGIVSVREPNGRVLEKEILSANTDFCDLGILPVVVNVRTRPGCNEVTVKNVFVSVEKTRLLKITYDSRDCMSELIPPVDQVCETALLIRGPDEKYVPAATVTVQDPKQSKLKADSFGRLLLAGKIGVPVHGSVEALGFQPSDFTFTCSGYDAQEQIVQLQRN